MGGWFQMVPYGPLPVGGLPFLPSQWRWRCSPSILREEFTNILGHHRRRVVWEGGWREEGRETSGVFMRVTPTQRMPGWWVGWCQLGVLKHRKERVDSVLLALAIFFSTSQPYCDPFPLFSPIWSWGGNFFLFPRTEKHTLQVCIWILHLGFRLVYFLFFPEIAKCLAFLLVLLKKITFFQRC